MNLDQIATQLTEMGVTDFWGNMFKFLANEAGYSGDHVVEFEKLSDSVAVSFGECQGEVDAQRVVIEALNQVLSINTYTDGTVFIVPITVLTLKKPSQQTKPKKTVRHTPAALIWDKLKSAGLCNEAVLFIVKALHGTLGLKSPTDERQVTIINRKDSFEIIYSHNGKPVVCDAPADFSIRLPDGTVVNGNAGVESAYYTVGKKKELTKEELLEKHARNFGIAIHTDKGSCAIPHGCITTDLGDEGIKLVVSVNTEFYFKDGVLHSSKGPAYTAFNDDKYYFVDGKTYSEEEFNNRILANQGSWKDIGA